MSSSNTSLLELRAQLGPSFSSQPALQVKWLFEVCVPLSP